MPRRWPRRIAGRRSCEALIPLLVERGGDVTTKEVARAAGIAEGTIFRVFPDKRSLLLAAAEEAMNPAGGEEAFDEALADVDRPARRRRRRRPSASSTGCG